MKHVAADLFDAAGEKWIVLVDRYSDYTWTDKLKDTSTATVTAKLNSWFVAYGYPEYIHTDGGPQFQRDFRAYRDKHYIHHKLSSQYPNPAIATAPRHSRWNVLAHPSALSEPTLLWAAKGVLCPHLGGTVTHRAHKEGAQFIFHKTGPAKHQAMKVDKLFFFLSFD